MKKSTLLVMAITMAAISAPLLAATVELQNGTTYKDAILVRLAPATFILQSGDYLFELTSDEISPKTLQDQDFSRGKAPVISHNYDEINGDGTVTMYSSLPITNNGKTALTETRWGLAPWERSHAEKRHYVDNRGITLKPTYNPPPEKWSKNPGKRIQITMPLSSPLAPGESMTITTRETTNWIHKTDEGMVYTHPGDYSEDRLIWRKVRLPLGAKIIQVTPQPSARFSHEGHEYLMWRRYYKKGEKYPLKVIFTFPSR